MNFFDVCQNLKQVQALRIEESEPSDRIGFDGDFDALHQEVSGVIGDYAVEIRPSVGEEDLSIEVPASSPVYVGTHLFEEVIAHTSV